MKVNDTNVRIIYPTQSVIQKQDETGLTPILNELNQANAAYVNVFNDYNFKSDILSKKHASFLYTLVHYYIVKFAHFWTKGPPKREIKKNNNSALFLRVTLKNSYKIIYFIV